jgi:PAS domain S-box-containing protein/putative nucleotidyltransferase with HDIG domain
MVDRSTHTVTPVTSYGTGTDYLDGIEISIDADNPHGRGPTGTAIRENRPFWLNDFGNSPITQPWQQKAGRFGWRSSASLPISRKNQAIGALTFYSSQRVWDSKEIRKLLEEMAGDISFALDKLHSETEAKALQSELLEAEQRFRSLVEQSIVGAYIIQDNQIVYANPRALHILGYSDDDDLTGVAPLEMIAAKDSELFATEIKKLERREINKLELVFSAIRKDGATIDVSTNSAIATYDSRPAIIGLLQDMSDRKVAEDQIRRYTKQLEHTFIQTVGLATTLSEMRDPYTAGHEQRVAEIAVAIGREMDLSEDRLEGLRVGGYLHDVGKMSVPVEILTKPTKLSTNEYLLIKEHAQAGYNVLKNVDFPWPVALIALQHHERIDGSGYPQGLKGDEIILEARITAVADVVESMASHRPYRAALGLDKALEEIERGRGTDYDAEVVSACLRLFREKGYVPPGDN